jgi:tryptophan synthase alpha chain
MIVPDLPPEEGASYLQLMRHAGLDPIQTFAPTSTDERMYQLEAAADGFIYCIARRGVTGAATSFDAGLESYLARCRMATELPLAVGFGISTPEDVDFLKGKAEIAVIGTATIKLVDEKGPDAVEPFLAALR